MTAASPVLTRDIEGDDSPLGRATMRRVSMRLLPFIFILYIFNFLDRTNVSIAKLQMDRDLQFGAEAFGLGAGIFFIGYALFEVPSNLFLARVGARWWLARIMISWGIIASAMMFVRTPMHFYVLRFLLGLAEAGFFPGIIYYLSTWYPTAQRARAASRFMIAIPLSSVLGGAIGGELLAMDGLKGLAGWQWLFLLEGLPSILLGIAVLIWLTEKPAVATWLAADQRAWLVSRLEQDESASSAPHGLPPLRALANPLLWVIAIPYLLMNTAAYGYIFWGPTIIKEALGTSNTETGFVVAAIAALAAAFMLFMSASSDRKHERFLHVTASTALIAVGFAGAALMPTAILRICFLALVPMGSNSFLAPYFCIPALAFRGSALAVAIALVNSIGNMGGFFGPNVIGLLMRTTGGVRGACMALSLIALAASACCLALRRHPVYAGQR